MSKCIWNYCLEKKTQLHPSSML